jgi:hypothetical protein
MRSIYRYILCCSLMCYTRQTDFEKTIDKPRFELHVKQRLHRIDTNQTEVH